MIPLASFFARSLGKRMGKASTEVQEKAGAVTTYLMEIFKNHKLIKIFQKEIYEKNRANKSLSELKEKNQKIQTVFVRLSPVMEILTGVMIAILIFYAGKLIAKEIPHDYSVRPGTHNWDYWRESIKSHLIFFEDFFKQN